MFKTSVLLMALALAAVGQAGEGKKAKASTVKPEAQYTSITEVQAAAEKGVPEAQFMLGLAVQGGKAGLLKDEVEALSWFRKAAKLGNTNAMNELGRAHEEGRGVPQNLSEAVMWYQQAAEHGDEWAQVRVGRAFTKGEGVRQDRAEAVRWYRKAAAQGSLSAQFYLGHALQTGEGAPQNYVEAAKWFRKAAEHGQGDAQFRLGMAYLEGQGVKKSVIEAYVWFSLATTSGHPQGARGRDLAAGMMPAQALPQAQARASKVAEEVQRRKKG